MLTVDLSVRIGEMVFPCPAILASGIMDEDAGSMSRMIRCGAGGAVTKSIGLRPRDGHANPTVVEVEGGILNAMGLPNPGIDEYGYEIKAFKRAFPDIPLIGSIYASSPEEFSTLGIKIQESGVDAVELNVSCPHARGLGLQVGSDPHLVKSIVESVKGGVDIPVWVKLSPNVSDIVSIALAAESGGCDGIVAINTLKAMTIDIDARRPVLSNVCGGLSGPAIHTVGLRCVYDISKVVDVPVIGVGGIGCGKDLIEYFMAGASLVQVGAGVFYRGPEVFSLICNETTLWLEAEGISSLSEIVGVANR